MHERSFSLGPILPERSRGIASNASHDENGPVFQQVSDTNINTRIDMLLVDEDTLNNMLRDSIC